MRNGTGPRSRERLTGNRHGPTDKTLYRPLHSEFQSYDLRRHWCSFTFAMYCPLYWRVTCTGASPIHRSAKRFLPQRRLPDSAIDVLDEAASSARFCPTISQAEPPLSIRNFAYVSTAVAFPQHACVRDPPLFSVQPTLLNLFLTGFPCCGFVRLSQSSDSGTAFAGNHSQCSTCTSPAEPPFQQTVGSRFGVGVNATAGYTRPRYGSPSDGAVRTEHGAAQAQNGFHTPGDPVPFNPSQPPRPCPHCAMPVRWQPAQVIQLQVNHLLSFTASSHRCRH